MKKIVAIFLFGALCSCGSRDTIEEIKQPSVLEITSEIVEVGQQITVTGSDLDDSPTFVLNGETLEATSINESEITLTVPMEASSGELKISFSDPIYDFKSYIKILDTNWKSHSSFNAVDIVFVSSATGFALEADHTTQKIKLNRTTSEGKSWSTIYEGSLVETFMAPVSDQTVWVKDSFNNFKRTNDGGETWQNIAVLDISYSITDMFFTNELVGYILVNKSGEGYIFKTIDGGQTWKESLKVNSHTSEVEVLVYKNGIIKLFNNEMNQLISTEDAGENWHTKDLNLTIAYKPVFSILNSSDMWLSMQPRIGIPGGLFKSADAGENWENVELPMLSEPTEHIMYTVFDDAHKGYLLTNKGGSLYTNDGGKTWKLFYLDINDITTVTFFENKIFMNEGTKLFQKTLFN